MPKKTLDDYTRRSRRRRVARTLFALCASLLAVGSLSLGVYLLFAQRHQDRRIAAIEAYQAEAYADLLEAWKVERDKEAARRRADAALDAQRLALLAQLVARLEEVSTKL